MNGSVGKTAVVVEDNDESFEFLKAILESLGYAVTRAPHEGQAFHQHVAAFASADLIVLDIILSESIDGFEVVKALTEHEFHGALIVASANAKNYIDSLIQVAEGNGIRVLTGIEKPYRKQDFEVALQGT
ncbi:MAG: response regulator [Alphaproteobacteria bacterium]|jgi:CheY-like chemotaxis protein|nr:response regulator [Alphaproteobacteria bacterium]